MHATSLARSYTFLAVVQGVARLAPAGVRCHAFTCPASIRTDRLAVMVDLIIAQFAHADLRREAIGVLVARTRADRHTNAVLGAPS